MVGRDFEKKIFLGGVSVSQKIPSVNEALGEFDLFVCGAGSDPRCVAVTSSFQVVAQKGLILDFQNRENESKTRHLSEISSNLEKCGVPVERCEIDSVLVSAAYKRIEESLVHALGDIDKNVTRVCLDFGSIPRAISLFVLALIRELRLATKITVVYPVGIYPYLDASSLGENWISTEGAWKGITVPYLEGNYSPEGKRIVVASIGLLGVKGRTFLSQFEPDKLIPILPHPGFRENYDQHISDQTDQLVDHFGVAEEDIILSPAGDVVNTFELVDEFLATCSSEDDISLVALGPKTHALAFALNCWSNGKTKLICRVPESYSDLLIEHSGDFFMYEIG